MERIVAQPWSDDDYTTTQFETRHYNDAMEDDIDEDDDGEEDDIDEDDDGEESIELNIDDELEMIIDETIEDHVAELIRILGRRWTCHDYPRTVIELTHQLATGALLVEEAVNLEVSHLEATGAEADQLAIVVADYFRMLMREWLGVDVGHSEDEEGGGDKVLSQFKTRHDNTGGEEDDGEETDNCCICLERLHRGLVATLHCRHEFHGDCIGRWLHRGQNFCPLCKARAIK